MATPLRKTTRVEKRTAQTLVHWYHRALAAGYTSDKAKRVAIQVSERTRQGCRRGRITNWLNWRRPRNANLETLEQKVARRGYTGGKEEAATFDRLVGPYVDRAELMLQDQQDTDCRLQCVTPEDHYS